MNPDPDDNSLGGAAMLNSRLRDPALVAAINLVMVVISLVSGQPSFLLAAGMFMAFIWTSSFSAGPRRKAG
jgi:hypothetical protein